MTPLHRLSGSAPQRSSRSAVEHMHLAPYAKRLFHVAALVVLFAGYAFAQANGRLQIHYMDVGQGDGVILISPQGQTVLSTTVS